VSDTPQRSPAYLLASGHTPTNLATLLTPEEDDEEEPVLGNVRE
jgi:hypothetical protein